MIKIITDCNTGKINLESGNDKPVDITRRVLAAVVEKAMSTDTGIIHVTDGCGRVRYRIQVTDLDRY